MLLSPPDSPDAGLPGVLFDAVRFGLSARLLDCDADGLAEMRRTLAAAGVLAPGGDPGRLRLALAVPAAGELGGFRAELRLGRLARDKIMIKQSSSITLNR